jgi:hypothetical protein
MKRDQIIDLLSVAAAYDQRTVGNADIAAWTLALGELDFDRARDAVVAHYREQTRRIMPADVRQHARSAPHPPPFAELSAASPEPPNQEYLRARDQMIEATKARDTRAMAPAASRNAGDRAAAWLSTHIGPGQPPGPALDAISLPSRWLELPGDPPELRRELRALAREATPKGPP